MKKLALATACLLFADPSFSQPAGEKTGINSALGVSTSTGDFVREAAIGDMFEIQSSQLAAQRSNGQTQAFASQMIADHSKTADELKGIIPDVPERLDSRYQKMLDKLVGLNGDKFTEQYESDQVQVHKNAVSLFQRYAKSGDNPELKDWAAKTLPGLEHHLKMAETLAK